MIDFIVPKTFGTVQEVIKKGVTLVFCTSFYNNGDTKLSMDFLYVV